MATSGDIYTNYFSEEYGSVRLRYHWSVASQSVDNNTTTISWTITTDGSMTSGYWYKAGPITMTMTATNGSFTSGTRSYSNSSRIQLRGGGTQVASGTAVLTHGDTGVGSFSVSMSAAIYYTSTNVSGSGTASLNTIPRATTPSFSTQNVTLGTAVTITLNRPSTSSFTHDLTYTFGTKVDQVIGTGVETSATWTPPTTLGSEMLTSSSGTCTITCKTYNGSTLIGTKTASITLSIPDTDAWKPSNSTTFSSTNALSSYPSVVSSVRAAVTFAGAQGSTVTSVSLTFQGKTYSVTPSSSPVTIISDPCSGSGTFSAVTRVTDSRGKYKESSTTITVLDYSTPTVSLNLTRVLNASGTNQNETGGYMRISLSGSVASLTGNTVSSIGLSYKIGNSSYTISVSSLPYDSASGGNNVAVSSSSSCTVTATITDTAGGTTSVIQTLPVGFKTLDFLAGGKGINIGSTAVNENLAINRDIMLGGNVYRKNLLKDLGKCTGTDRSVSFSYTQDGGVLVNGTNNTTSTTAFKEYGTFMGIAGHKYVLSGGVGTSNYYVYVFGQSAVKDTTGNGVEFTFPSGVTTPWSVRVGVAGGKTASNVTFYPMIRDAGITDSTWEPYVPDIPEIQTDYNTKINNAIADHDTKIGVIRTKQNKNLFRVSARTKTINFSEYATAGSSSGVYLVLLRPWTVSLKSGAVYIVSFITNDYGAASCIEESSGTTLSISGTTATITFPDSAGGMVAIFGGPIV